MKGLRRFASILLTVLLLLSMTALIAGAADAVQPHKSKNYVIVTDASGSMLDTDPDGFRYDAIEYFLGVLPESGDYVGSVVYTERILKKTDIKAITGQSDKDAITRDIRSAEVKPDANTDIGKAFKEAVDMLKTGGDQSLPKVIVFLSDGKTDPDNTRHGTEVTGAARTSLNVRDEAITEAKRSGIEVYTICLNVNGSGMNAELKPMATGTGGESVEVTSAQGLEDAYNRILMWVNDINGTMGDEYFDANGNLEKDFLVPAAGIAEANIFIGCGGDEISDIRLTMPSGSDMPADQLSAHTISARTFTMIKLVAPEGGTWHLHAKGKPGAVARIGFITTDNLAVELTADTDRTYHPGESVTLTGLLYTGDSASSVGYDDFEATLEVFKLSESGERGDPIDTVIMDATDAAYSTDYTLGDIGSYEFTMTVRGFGLEKSDDLDHAVDVGNTAPEVVTPVIKKHFWVVPFLTSDETIDLSEAVGDAEDSTLNYEVSSSVFSDTSYRIEGDKMVITSQYFGDMLLLREPSQGIFDMKAVDSLGATAAFEVEISTTNIGLIVIIAIVAIGLIILLLAFLKIRHDYLLKFKGEITVSKFGDTGSGGYSGYGTDAGFGNPGGFGDPSGFGNPGGFGDPSGFGNPGGFGNQGGFGNPGGFGAGGFGGYGSDGVTMAPSRGRYKLKFFDCAMPGINVEKSYFQATGKNYIYLISKTPLYADSSATAQKKIRIAAGVETRISPSREMDKGITVLYTSLMEGYF